MSVCIFVILLDVSVWSQISLDNIYQCSALNFHTMTQYKPAALLKINILKVEYVQPIISQCTGEKALSK